MKGAVAVFLLVALSGAGAAVTRSATDVTGAQDRAPVLSRMTRAECPAARQPPVAHSLARIQAVLPTLVEQQLGYGVNPNGTSYRGWYLLGATSLAPGYIAAPGAGHWRSLAANHCGIQTAERSWLITLAFPEMHVINSGGYLLLALTARGWRIWAQA